MNLSEEKNFGPRRIGDIAYYVILGYVLYNREEAMKRLGYVLWPHLYFIVHSLRGHKRRCHQTDEVQKFNTKFRFSTKQKYEFI